MWNIYKDMYMVRLHFKSLNVIMDFSLISVSVFPLYYLLIPETRISDTWWCDNVSNIYNTKHFDIVSHWLVHLIDFFLNTSTHQVKKCDTLTFLNRIDTCKGFKSVFHPVGMKIFIYTLPLLVRVITFFYTTCMIFRIIRIALFCMVIIVRYMCSIIRIFLITVMVVLLYVCLYHSYFY